MAVLHEEYASLKFKTSVSPKNLDKLHQALSRFIEKELVGVLIEEDDYGLSTIREEVWGSKSVNAFDDR